MKATHVAVPEVSSEIDHTRLLNYADGPGQTVWVALGWIVIVIFSALIMHLITACFANVSSLYSPALGEWIHRSSELLAGIGAQGVLAWGAIRGARRIGAGHVARGLANRPIRHPRMLGLLILAWFGIVVVLPTSIVLLTGWTPPDNIPKILEIPHEFWGAVITIILICGCAPVCEELFFRGWLWTALRRYWGPASSFLVTSGLWLALHGGPGLLIWRPLLLLPGAILFTLARHYCNSVRASIIMHCISNTLVASVEVVLMLGGET